MPTYVAFLRAINLGPTRKFAKADIVAAVESTGATDVATYINTGNVRLTTSMRSRAKVESTLELAFSADRGFEVPTMAFRKAEIADLASDADELWAEHGEPQLHYITLFKDPPATDVVRAVHELDRDGELVVVRDRAAHVLLFGTSLSQGSVLQTRAFADLGVGTARSVTVIRTLAERWC